ncbi:MAG: hypothetical protein LC643_08285 [Bacteroidales bacterium]|nr:hypothetical protein [Bacteroidales bacterium]
MKRKTFIWVLSGMAAFVLLLLLLTKVAVEPWLEGKIRTAISENSGDYLVEVERVEVSVLQAGVELEGIRVHTKEGNGGEGGLSGTIEALSVKGISIFKALLRKDIDISEIGVIGARFEGAYVVQEKDGSEGSVSPLNIRVDKLFFEDLMVDVTDGASAQSFMVKDGYIELEDMVVAEQDSISPALIGAVHFEASAFKTLTADSLYTLSVVGLNYSADSKELRADTFALQPNYSEYGFTSRHAYETDRFDVMVSDLLVRDLSVADYLQTDSLSIAYIELGVLNLEAFRDKREAFRHVERPTFQEEIYAFSGALNIDSMAILSGTIVYSEHAEKGGDMGSVWFSEVDSRMYNITNDTLYKTEEAYLEWQASALLMGAGQISIDLKARIYDPQNAFTVKGTLWGMEAAALNPILEDNAFISIQKGEINGMEFYISANNTKATGTMELRYRGLEFEVVDKQTGEASGAVDQIKSMIADWIVVDWNPMPGQMRVWHLRIVWQLLSLKNRSLSNLGYPVCLIESFS